VGTAQEPQANAKYMGSDKCQMCHASQHKSWSRTPHSRAFELLVNVDQAKNAACLPCHSTGYGKGGFTDEASTPGLKNVGCEACHGPGSIHMAEIDKTKITRVPSAAVCAACHLSLQIHPPGD